MTTPENPAAAHSIARLADGCAELNQLLTGLLRPRAQVARDIRLARKLGKSLRAGFTLLGLEKSAGSEIQAIGRLLGPQRDATSRFDTWQRLAWIDEPDVSAAITSLLASERAAAAIRPPAVTLAWALERLRSAKAEIPTDLEKSSDSQIHKKAKQLRRRMIKRCRTLDSDAEEDFHEARKALKAWLGAVVFLADAACEKHPEINQLGNLLGKENDLSTLEIWLKSHGFTAKLVPGLWKKLAKRHVAIRHRIIRQAAALFPA